MRPIPPHVENDRFCIDRFLAGGQSDLSRYFLPPSGDARDPRVWTGTARDHEAVTREFWRKYEDGHLAHDEPWLTLVGLYGLFGDQSDLGNPRRVAALNGLLDRVYRNRTPAGRPPAFASIAGVHVEVYLRENKRFQSYVREHVFRDGAYHPYPDRRSAIESKLAGTRPSLEGNTNLDATISGRAADGRWIHVFIEAKFLSDISKDITYLPVRNQIARNIDCALDVLTPDDSGAPSIEEMWFLLLTPGQYRTPAHGGASRSPLDALNPARSRLYCYKMDEYLTANGLRADLPHWGECLVEDQWVAVSSRVGWLTFEDISGASVANGLLPGDREAALLEFLRAREIRPA